MCTFYGLILKKSIFQTWTNFAPKTKTFSTSQKRPKLKTKNFGRWKKILGWPLSKKDWRKR